MTTLILGATGATGRWLTKELLDRGESVRVIVRSPEGLPTAVRGHENLEVIQASLLDLSDAELVQYVRDCDTVASCLGHNLTLRGLFGPPRRLVTDAVSRLCEAVRANAPEKPVKYVLMNTTGNWNRDLNEPISFGERIVIGLLRLVLPPQADNEQAADFLRIGVGQNDAMIEWAAVRPDSLIDEDEVTPYEVYPSPIRSGVFDPGQTSRINVAHFMAALITEDAVWQQWKGQMPVIYNKAE
jgi:NAD(P)-dependent dehydrogenase (short-subunit alcohol dehydrogenase family)